MSILVDEIIVPAFKFNADLPLYLFMTEAAEFIDRIKNAYTREELPTKTLLIKEGVVALKAGSIR